MQVNALFHTFIPLAGFTLPFSTLNLVQTYRFNLFRATQAENLIWLKL